MTNGSDNRIPGGIADRYGKKSNAGRQPELTDRSKNEAGSSNSQEYRNQLSPGEMIDVCKKQLELAAVLGADAILVIPGAVGVDFIPGSEVVAYDKAYDRALEAIGKLAPEAEQLGVAIGIENVWNKFLLSPLEMRGFIDAIGSRFVGSYLDVGNIVHSGYPEQWVRILGDRIKKVHFKDYRREAGGLHGFVDLLAGDVDYPAVVSALREIGYDGYVTGEMILAYKHYTEQIIFNTSASMDAILGRTDYKA